MIRFHPLPPADAPFPSPGIRSGNAGQRTIWLPLALVTAFATPQPLLCTLGVWFPARDSGDVTFAVAEAASDTARAGAGPVDFTSRAHQIGAAEPGDIFGQVMHIDRFVGGDSLKVAEAFARNGSREAVLVPWDYGASCEPRPWGESARWSEPGQPGLYRMVMRPEADWAGSLPTFDVFMALRWPYPSAPYLQDSEAFRDATSLLDPYELFDLLATLPTYEEVRQDPERAERIALEWEQSHPSWLDRFPVRQALRSVYSTAGTARARTVRLPFAGTYRLTVQLPGQEPRTIYLRTPAHPLTSRLGALEAGGASPMGPMRAVEHSVRTYAALGEADLLAGGRSPAGQDGCAGSTVLIATVPEDQAPNDAERWQVYLDPLLLRRCFPEDPVVEALLERYSDAVAARAAADRERWTRMPLRPDPNASFEIDASGTVRFEQEVVVDGKVIFSVHGVRISEEVVTVGGRP
jgi:hypothetical protein